jgi:hypothetical protein
MIGLEGRRARSGCVGPRYSARRSTAQEDPTVDFVNAFISVAIATASA